MATLDLFVSGRSAKMNEIVRQGYIIKVVLTTPEVEDADLVPSIVITTAAGAAVETIACPPVSQAVLATLLNAAE